MLAGFLLPGGDGRGEFLGGLLAAGREVFEQIDQALIIGLVLERGGKPDEHVQVANLASLLAKGFQDLEQAASACLIFELQSMDDGLKMTRLYAQGIDIFRSGKLRETLEDLAELAEWLQHGFRL